LILRRICAAILRQFRLQMVLRQFGA
jgi:hypothetical protein